MPPEQNDQVQYSGDEFTSSAAQGAATKPDLMDRLVGWGVAGDRQQAQYVLIGVTVVCTCIGLYFAFFSGSSAPDVPMPPGVLGGGQPR